MCKLKRVYLSSRPIVWDRLWDFSMFLGFFSFVYQFAMGWLSMPDGETFAYGPLFVLNLCVGKEHRAFYDKGQHFFYLECTRETFLFVRYDEFCCWNCSVVLKIHRRSCVNSKKGVESMKLNWRHSCSKQSPETETFCQKTIDCEWSWSQLK